jgi:hypothetical protein
MSLVTIRPGVAFDAPAAASFQRIEAALGRRADVNRTTVPYQEQLDLWQAWDAGKYPHFVLHPKYSEHVYRAPGDGGNAWDTDERGQILEDHGWLLTNSSEPWHREYFIEHDNHLTPVTYEEEEEDMDTRSIIGLSVQAPKFELLRGRKRSISKAEWAAMRKVEAAGGPKLCIGYVTKAELDAIPGK